MRWVAAVRERLLAVFFARREDGDTIEEMVFHVEMEADRLVREEGLDPAEARRRASIAFGGVEKHREAAREARGLAWLSSLSLDARLGARLLRRFPGLTLIGGLGIAVGVAVSVGFFTFMVAHIYPDVPLPEGERIVAIENRDVEIDNEDRRALHDFFTWREQLRTIEDIGAFRNVTRTLVAGEATPEPVTVAEMTAAGFTVARVRALMGRYLLPEDERAGSPPVIVLGFEVWQDRSAADPEIVGREVRLGGVVHTVVGVMPEGFAFPIQDQYWTALRENPFDYERRTGPQIHVFGRLAPGVTMEMAQAELTAVGRQTAAAFPETHEHVRPMVMPYVHSITDIQGITFWELATMQAMMSLLLLVVALNVAVLIYARTATRRGEIAVRSALGASRHRIVGQLFLEALLLSAGAAVVGLGLARVGIQLGDGIMEAEMGRRPFWLDYGLRPSTVLWTLGMVVLAAALIGVLPGLQATGRGLKADLTRIGTGADMRLGKVWTALIVTQITIALVGLPAAAAIGWEEVRFATNRPTFPAREVMSASLQPAPGTDGEAEAAHPAQAAAAFGARLTDVLRLLNDDPAVTGVTFRAGPLAGRIQVEGTSAVAEPPTGHQVAGVGVGAGFIGVYDVRILAGRAFNSADFDGTTAAVIVNEPFVRDVLGGANAVGRRFRFADAEADASGAAAAPDRWYEVVGVIRDLFANRLAPETIRPGFFYPMAPGQAGAAQLAIRLRQPVQPDFGNRIRTITAEVDPDLRLGIVRSMADVYRQRDLALRLVALGITLAVLSVLLLSGAGIYALMSFTVTRRRAEIGIRSALGAKPRQVLRTIFIRAAGQVGVGMALGIGVALLLEIATDGGLMRGRGAVLLPPFSILMAATALVAGWGPARRGLRVQPSEALRAE
jgi:predicted permease